MSELPVGVESLGGDWMERVFSIAPLVLVGTREKDGSDDLAPKHMVTPVGYQGYFAFACTPAHNTYGNCKREGSFTVSYPRPRQVVLASLAASPREGERKPVVDAIPTFPATRVPGVLVRDAYLFLECRLDRIIDGFGDASLVIGKVEVAHAASDALRRHDRDDQEALGADPLLVYLAPGRHATVARSDSFPFPEGFGQDR